MSAQAGSFEFRDSLTLFSEGIISASELAERHPNCQCEKAVTVRGGFGPIEDNETLRFYLTSANVKFKKSYDLNVENLKECMVNSSSFSRVLTGGVSICRIDFATEVEILAWVNGIYNSLIKNRPNSGGIFGSIDISATTIRNYPLENGTFCIHETPLDMNQGEIYQRPSHADIVWSNSKFESDNDAITIKTSLFNVLKNKGFITSWSNYKDFQFSKYLPKVIRLEQNL